MKKVIAVAKKSGENKKLLTIENTDETAITEVAKVSSAVDLRNNHS